MAVGEQPIKSGLSKEQKIGFILLLIFAIFAITLGVVQIRNTMYSKFALTKKIPPTVKDDVNTVDALRFRDTDHDGLSDFDELYVYSTSPYLADSDSDGISDGEEIKQGKNPLCPEGQTCEDTSATQITNSISSTLQIMGQTSSPPTSEAPLDLSQALQDPTQVRAMLLGAGVKEDVLKNISDADLMKVVAEIMTVTNTPVNNLNLNQTMNQ